MAKYTVRKGALWALFLLSSCVCKNESEWVYSQTLTGSPCYNSARLYLPGCNSFKELDVEIIRTAVEVRMYLNVHSLEIPIDPENPSQVTVIARIGNTSTNILGELLLGGQRIFIPPWDAGRIISALNEGQDVRLRIGQYCSEITPDSFAALYCKLMQAF